MSERILKALMQLFAIIAHPESSANERRQVVERYLEKQLDQDTVEEYLKIYDKHYQANQKRSSRKKIAKYTSASSVRVLKICTQINEELITRHKVIVLIQLLEFLKSEERISPQELEFVHTVADTFNLPTEGYQRLINFVLNPFEEIQKSDRLLSISNEQLNGSEEEAHWHAPDLNGEIKILRLKTVDMYVMRYQGSSELFMNGQALETDQVHLLQYGASIRNRKIDPIYFSDIASAFHREAQKNRLTFHAQNIEYHFNEKKVGIHDLSFAEESGKLVGIIGSSGAGKTTLLNVLNGSAPPSRGAVLINGFNLHTEKSKLEGVIGHVSQDDLLIESLTVFENLYYNAKLCFGNHTPFQIIRMVLKMLKDLGLYEARNLKVGNPLDKKISGGQRKRLNIALELIREPSVLFLDEPTSGLSSRDSAKIMDLLKELSLKGKLVFVVIHQPSSDIYKMFDRLLILDTGGYLIFNGNPLDAVTYFKSQSQRANRTESECTLCGNVDADQIFNIVESPVLDEYGTPTQTRKIAPSQWYKFYQQRRQEQKELEQEKSIPPVTYRIPAWFKQFGVFIKRDLLSKLANRQYLFINLVETPLLAFILAYIIKFYNIDAGNTYGYSIFNNSNLPVYLFMAVIVALFIGLTLSAEEIIKDQKILKREQFLNLSKSSYLLSKVVILFGISALQALMFTLIGNTIIEIKGMYFYYWLVLFSSWCFANLLGLNISDSFKTVITIYILVPFILIPQLILSGIIVKFDKLNPDISSPNSIPWYGEIITARWAYEALAVKQFKDNDYEKNFYVFDKVMSRADYMKNYWLPILKNKLNECERYMQNPEKQDKFNQNLQLLSNEVALEVEKNQKVKYASLAKLNPEDLDKSAIDVTRKYFQKLHQYYIKLYNSASREKDQYLSKLQEAYPDRQAFIGLKKANANDRLNEFVRNSNELERIIEYDNRLYQKVDPIYKDPDGSFIKAHFYAPRKKVFGNYYDTFWVNIGVIWMMTILLYITLYYGALRKLLQAVENNKSRFKRNK